MLPPLTKFKKVALDLLFPQWCIGCGREGAYICDSCRRTLTIISPPVCPRCGRPRSRGEICYECADWQAQIDGIRAPFFFDGVIRRAIHDLKYNNLRALAVPLAELLHDYLKEKPFPGEVIVPVPIHSRRYRERGYNQSALLARELGGFGHMPVVENSLVRSNHALPQARSGSIEERRENVTGAFACRDERLKGKEVILVDDVSTSGATLDACAGVLKSAGAKAVWGLVIALEL